MANASKFLTLTSGIPTLVSSQTTASGAASGAVVGLNGSDVVDVTIGGTGAATLAAHNVLLGEGTSPLGTVAPSAASGVPLVSQGSSSDPAFGTAVVPGGGTGATTLTAHAVLLGEGTSTLGFATIGNAGYVLTDNGSGTDPTFQPAPTGTISKTILASASLSAGDLANVYSNSGTANVRPADNTDSATFCNAYVPSAITNGTSGTVVFGTADVTGLSGLTVGPVFLGTSGGVTSTAPSSSGDIVQPVGFAYSSTELILQPGQNFNIA